MTPACDEQACLGIVDDFVACRIDAGAFIPGLRRLWGGEGVEGAAAIRALPDDPGRPVLTASWLA